LREACPKEEIWHFSPFVFTKLHRHLWRMLRNVKVDWSVILLLAPVALELLRQALGWRFGEDRLFFLHPDLRSMLWPTLLILLTTVLSNISSVGHSIDRKSGCRKNKRSSPKRQPSA